MIHVHHNYEIQTIRSKNIPDIGSHIEYAPNYHTTFPERQVTISGKVHKKLYKFNCEGLVCVELYIE